MSDMKFTKDGNVLTMERTFDAAQDKVWAAWAIPETFVKWWGPRGWKTVIKEFDFAPGGTMLYGMLCEDKEQSDWYGKTSWGKQVYEEVQPMSMFSYVDYFCDENGAATEGMPTTRVSMRFEDVDGKTKVVSVATYETEAELAQVLGMGMEEGIRQTWDRLVETL